MRYLLPAAVSRSVSVPESAQAQHCVEPSAPYCIDGLLTFDDEWSFSSCRCEVERYVDQVVSFQYCLSNWYDQVGEEAERVIERFNCRTEGRVLCL